MKARKDERGRRILKKMRKTKTIRSQHSRFAAGALQWQWEVCQLDLHLWPIFSVLLTPTARGFGLCVLRFPAQAQRYSRASQSQGQDQGSKWGATCFSLPWPHHRAREMKGYVWDKSLSASPWVTDHTKGHQQSLFEALHLLLQGFALWPCYKSAYNILTPSLPIFYTPIQPHPSPLLHITLKLWNCTGLWNTDKWKWQNNKKL